MDIGVTDTKVYLLGNTATFVVDAIREGLEDMLIDCIVQPMNPNLIAEISDEKVLFFIALDSMVVQNVKAFEAIRNKLVINEEYMAYLIGYTPDIAQAKELLGSENITGAFKRPINTKEVVEELIQVATFGKPLEVKKRIMVVDDSGSALRNIKHMLEDKYDVTIVRSGANALQMLGSKLPDLILLDYEMPGLSGADVLKSIRENQRTKGLPVIFLTAKGEVSVVQSVLPYNPQGYILKTTPQDDFLDRIEAFFDNHS